MYYSFNPGIVYHYSLDLARNDLIETIEDNLRARSKLQNYLHKEISNNQYVFSTASTSTKQNINDIFFTTKAITTLKKSIIIELNKNETKIISNKSLNSSNYQIQTADKKRFQVIHIWLKIKYLGNIKIQKSLLDT